ncbi:iron uptake porin [Floridanema evergladense]|uniref:Iron uptake porin n=1 Tax=Floridaenema evergladense BLCC-F167 TaxID=3153639 RepID=A0ABV4WIH7_9CYAN
MKTEMKKAEKSQKISFNFLLLTFDFSLGMLLLTMSIASPAYANTDTNSSVEPAQIVDVDPVTQLQVTAVSQLSDVRPTDWAFQALQSLVERYGCIEGYPDRTYRGNRAMTRYEFAAGLNACLNRIQELIAASNTSSVTKEDLEALRRLQEEFAAELANLRGRVDALEARTTKLESQQFSTTTKLNAEIIFAVADTFGDRATRNGAGNLNTAGLSGLTAANEASFRNDVTNTILASRVRLNFDTSFVGSDRLRVRLQARNITSFSGSFTGTNMTRLSFDGNNNNQFDIDYIYYRFRPTPKTTVHLSAVNAEYSDLIYTINPYLEGSGDGSISRFGRYSPIYRGFGAGATIEHKFSQNFELTLGYLAGDAANPTDKNGLFNGYYSALAQLLIRPVKTLELGLIYSHSYFPGGGNTGVNTTFSTGSLLARRPFGNVSTTTDSVQFGASFRITPKVVLSGWFDYMFADSKVSDENANILNFTTNLVFPDLGKKGNLGAIVFGVPPKVTRNTIAANEDRDTSFHFEALYRYQINKNIAITPGVIVITSPEHNSDNDTIMVGVVRTTFKF